jgi:hypothetical protein
VSHARLVTRIGLGGSAISQGSRLCTEPAFGQLLYQASYAERMGNVRLGGDAVSYDSRLPICPD